jgi:hypothetical protein
MGVLPSGVRDVSKLEVLETVTFGSPAASPPFGKVESGPDCAASELPADAKTPLFFFEILW